MNLLQATVAEFLSVLKGLSLNQYDDAKATTVERVKKLIGEKPTKESMKREQASLLTPLDALALVVFIAAFMVSSVHIFGHMSELATQTYKVQADQLGIIPLGQVYAVIHQLGFILLAEASMLLFMVTWRMQTKEIIGYYWRIIPKKGLSVYLLLSLVAMIFVLASNLSSGLTLLEALMPPVFTIGLGLHVEGLITEMLVRRKDLAKRLAEALDIWENATDDPTTHPKYRQLLMREIWDRIVKLRENRELADAPARLKLSAVHREMERDGWTEEAVATEDKIEAVAQQTGVSVKIAESLVMEEGNLNQLADMVEAASEGLVGDNAIITTPAGSANLEELTWTDAGQSGRQYGPYGTRKKMAASIRSVGRTNTRRS